MSELAAKIEALLFVATKPISTKQLATVLHAQGADVDAAVAELRAARNVATSGIHLLTGEEGIVLVSNSEFAELVSNLAKEDIEPELTRPSLETLTIIAYRGPMTKPEIEAIRGVNCTLILRNLLMRGLIVGDEDPVKLQMIYAIPNDALRYLGLHSVQELPEYDSLHGNTKIDTLIAALTDSSDV